MPQQIHRIMIVGQPGSGKSTLARALGEITDLPVFHIDQIHYQSGWVERSRAEKTAMCQQVHALASWIFEGGHSVTWSERLERCDMLIWLDIPLPVRVKRVVLRSLRYWGRSRPDLPEGCPEQFDWSFYRWIWDTRKSARQQIKRLIAEEPTGKPVFVLRSRRDIARFLEQAKTNVRNR